MARALPPLTRRPSSEQSRSKELKPKPRAWSLPPVPSKAPVLRDPRDPPGPQPPRSSKPVAATTTAKFQKLAEEMALEEEEESKSFETPEDPAYAKDDRQLAELLAAFSQATERSKEGDFEEAIQAWTNVLQLEDGLQAYQERGAAYASLGRFDEAEEDFQEALKRASNDEELASVYFSRGSARGDAGDEAQAIADFGEALKLEPDRLEAWLSRGTAHLALGHLEAASDDAEAALKLQRDSASCWGLLGAVRQRQCRFREAVDACQMALKLEPELSWAHRCLEASLAGLDEDYAYWRGFFLNWRGVLSIMVYKVIRSYNDPSLFADDYKIRNWGGK
eukprot:symbB.v1.2.000297.t1/scaffold24.1/size427761/13